MRLDEPHCGRRVNFLLQFSASHHVTLYRILIVLESTCAIAHNREYHRNRRERQRPFNESAPSLRSAIRCLDNRILENAQRMVRLLAP